MKDTELVLFVVAIVSLACLFSVLPLISQAMGGGG